MQKFLLSLALVGSSLCAMEEALMDKMENLLIKEKEVTEIFRKKSEQKIEFEKAQLAFNILNQLGKGIVYEYETKVRVEAAQFLKEYFKAENDKNSKK